MNLASPDYGFFYVLLTLCSNTVPLIKTKMAPTAPLAIATSSVQRLVKEEASYHRELEEQTKRIAKLESETGTDDDGNREFLLKQEVCVCVSYIYDFPGLAMNE